MNSEDVLDVMWRELRNDYSEGQLARFYGAVTALNQVGLVSAEQVELWLYRIKECPGHDDEGGRSWCAYCGNIYAKDAKAKDSAGAKP